MQQGVEPDAAEGAVLYEVSRSSFGHPAFAFATYKYALPWPLTNLGLSSHFALLQRKLG